MIAIAQVAPLLCPLGSPSRLATPQLVVVDREDGSGVSVSIDGITPQATNQVFVRDFSLDLSTADWRLAGAVNGDGQLQLALPVGHYLAYLTSTWNGQAGVSPVVFSVVSDGSQSLHARCLAAVQSRIRSLGLSGLASENVRIRKVPVDRQLTGGQLPAIVLVPHRAAAPPESGTNGQDDVAYDVLVVIWDRDNQEASISAGMDRQLAWREQISRSFRHQRLAGVPEIFNAEVEPAEELMLEAWKHDLLASALLLRFYSREARRT